MVAERGKICFDLIVRGSDNIGRVNQGVYMGTVGETQGDGESGPWPARWSLGGVGAGRVR